VAGACPSGKGNPKVPRATRLYVEVQENSCGCGRSRTASLRRQSCIRSTCRNTSWVEDIALHQELMVFLQAVHASSSDPGAEGTLPALGRQVVDVLVQRIAGSILFWMPSMTAIRWPRRPGSRCRRGPGPESMRLALARWNISGCGWRRCGCGLRGQVHGSLVARHQPLVGVGLGLVIAQSVASA